MTRPTLLTRVINSALAFTSTLVVCLHGTAAQAGQDTLTQFEYDANGNATQVTDPRGPNSNLSYDPLNRLKQQLLPPSVPGGARTSINLTYDGLNQVASVVDPRNLSTLYTVDGIGNELSLSSPDTGVDSATYDAAGNLKSRTDAKGKTKFYTYDALNRVTKIGYGSGTPTVFEFDGGTNAKGRLTKMTYEGGSTTYAYDGLGRVISQVQTLGIASPLTISYAYGTSGSVLGKLTELTYPSGNQLVFSYDAMGQVSNIWLRPTNSNGLGTDPTATKLLTDITYTGFGKPSAWAWGNSTGSAPNVYARTFDLDGRITTYPLGRGASNGTLRTLAYDAAGRIISATHTGTGVGAFAPVNFNQSYGYDDLNRLTGFSGSVPTQSYQYDANGNRTGTTIGAASYANTIAANSNRLSATEGPQPTTNIYDAAGNLTGNGTVTHSYSDRGRLKTATIGSNVVTYFVNALGQRVKKTGPWAVVNRGINQYVYDEQGRLVGEYDGEGRVLQETVYLNDLPVAVLKQATTANTAAAVVVDNTDTAQVNVTGTWPVATSAAGYLGTNYQSHVAATVADSFTWNLNLAAAGRYSVDARWTSGADRTTTAQYSISGLTAATVNQQLNNGVWVSLSADKTFDVGVAPVTLKPASVGNVIADAVRATPLVVATNVYYVYPDHLNTPRVITRASDNKLVWRWDSADPFGAAVPNENPQALGVFTYNPRFPGQLFDKETRLHYNYFRDYDPQTGRYIESDPLGLAAGINTYAYVNSNPLSNADPFGLRPLNEREKRCLAPYVPQVDLDSAEIHEEEAPWYLGGDFAAITRGNNIYFQPGVYDGSTVRGIAYLAHELHHVGQYREGKTWLDFAVAGIMGHGNSELEKPAFALQDKVKADLYPVGNANCECKASDLQASQVTATEQSLPELVEKLRYLKERLEAIEREKAAN